MYPGDRATSPSTRWVVSVTEAPRTTHFSWLDFGDMYFVVVSQQVRIGIRRERCATNSSGLSM